MSQLASPGFGSLENQAGQQFFSKTITFTGAAGNGAIGTVALGTVTGGLVVIDDIAGRCTTALTGATAQISLGTTNQTALFIALTTATGLTATAALWVSTTPTQGGIALPAANAQGWLVNENLIITVGTAAVATGVLEIDCLWHPISSGATLA